MCIPSLGYRFGIRLVGLNSVLSAELYSIFCALKYIFRLWCLPTLCMPFIIFGTVFSLPAYPPMCLRSSIFFPSFGNETVWLISVLDRDFRYWCCSQWPYIRSSSGRSEYFNRITFNNPRPWFTGSRIARGYVSLVTRLRSSHICTGSHFIRMGWDLDAGCGCVAELKSLAQSVSRVGPLNRLIWGI